MYLLLCNFAFKQNLCKFSMKANKVIINQFYYQPILTNFCEIGDDERHS